MNKLKSIFELMSFNPFRHSESIFVSYLVIICQLVLYQEKGATILNDACQTLQLSKIII